MERKNQPSGDGLNTLSMVQGSMRPNTAGVGSLAAATGNKQFMGRIERNKNTPMQSSMNSGRVGAQTHYAGTLTGQRDQVIANL